jgi:hypothetical protein
MVQLTIIASPLLLHFVATLSTRLMAENEPVSMPVAERIEMEGASLTNTNAASAKHQLPQV